jgi:predicted RNA polymerase sigma factor
MTETLEARTTRLLREVSPQVLGALVRRFREFSAVEDALQEALLAASQSWPKAGIPDVPAAWLFRVASRKIADHVRSATARRRRETLVPSLVPFDEQLALAPDGLGDGDLDDTCILLFMCCHPVLREDAALALTLRAVGGLTTAEIARAFFVPEATMAQRIVRAKQRIVESGVPFERPDGGERCARLSTVMTVLYLIFNEGYMASSGDKHVRTDLANEALRLATILHRALPDETEVAGLLALMKLTDARRAARTGPSGEIVPLDEQDRTKWDRRAIDEGTALIGRTLGRGSLGPYQVQAAIAALHDEAPSADATDWPQILALYEVLFRLNESPVVALNLAVAAAMVHGPEEGLARLAEVAEDSRLRDHHRVTAVRAHLLERAGRRDEAAEEYRRAASGTASLPEQRYLLLRASRLVTEAADSHSKGELPK